MHLKNGKSSYNCAYAPTFRPIGLKLVFDKMAAPVSEIMGSLYFNYCLTTCYVPSKRRFTYGLLGTISQKMATFKVILLFSEEAYEKKTLASNLS
jgi:hypothetical protein